ncbi:hypothetical protein JCM8547_006438 [Rhodosporidiobolus lusitaniae]
MPAPPLQPSRRDSLPSSPSSQQVHVHDFAYGPDHPASTTTPPVRTLPLFPGSGLPSRRRCSSSSPRPAHHPHHPHQRISSSPPPPPRLKPSPLPELPAWPPAFSASSTPPPPAYDPQFPADGNDQPVKLPSRLRRVVGRVMAPANRQDLEALEQHWNVLLRNEQDYRFAERPTALSTTIPPLAARWVDLSLLRQPGEDDDEWEYRIRGLVKDMGAHRWMLKLRYERMVERMERRSGLVTAREETECENAQAELRLVEKKLKYLRKRARWAFRTAPSLKPSSLPPEIVLSKKAAQVDNLDEPFIPLNRWAYPNVDRK